MATPQGIVDFCTGLNIANAKINNAQSYDETRSHIALALSIVDSMLAQNPGRATSYVQAISVGYQHLETVLDTNNAFVVLSEINEAIRAYLTYISSHWWQFGAITKQHPSAYMTLPQITPLMSSP